MCHLFDGSVQRLQRRSRKYLSKSEVWAAILFFWSAPPPPPQKKTNLVEDVEILLHVKLSWIKFSGFREVGNVTTNERPVLPSCFSVRPKTQTWLRTWRSCLLSNYVEFHSAVSGEKSKMCQSINYQRPGLSSCFSDRPEKHKVEILLPVKFCWILFSGFRDVKYTWAP